MEEEERRQEVGPTYGQHPPPQQWEIATTARIQYQGRDHDTAQWQAALRQLDPPCAPGQPLNNEVLYQADQLISKQP